MSDVVRSHSETANHYKASRRKSIPQRLPSCQHQRLRRNTALTSVLTQLLLVAFGSLRFPARASFSHLYPGFKGFCVFWVMTCWVQHWAIFASCSNVLSVFTVSALWCWISPSRDNPLLHPHLSLRQKSGPRFSPPHISYPEQLQHTMSPEVQVA